MYKALWLVLMSISGGLYSGAQTSLDSVRSITVEDGLPQGWVFDMVQDKQGFVWLAANGLFRYDGRNFKDFTPTIKQNALWPNTGEIRRLQLDSSNNLWLTYASGIIVTVNTITGHTRNLVEEPAFAWLKTPDQRYVVAYKANTYFATSADSLFRFNPANGQHASIPLPPGELFVSVGSSHDNQLFVATTRGFYQLQHNALQKIIGYAPLPAAEAYLQDSVLRLRTIPTGQIVENKSGQLVIATRGGIYYYQSSTHQVSYQPLERHIQYIEGVLVANTGAVYCITNQEVNCIDPDMKTIVAVSSSGATLNYPLIQDHSGTIWAATSNATGIRLFNPKPRSFRSFPYTNGFSHDVLQPWLHKPIEGIDYGSYSFRCNKDRFGNIWVVTNVVTIANQHIVNDFYTYYLSKTGYHQVSFGQDISPRGIAFSKQGQCWMVVRKKEIAYLARAYPDKQTIDIIAPLPDFPKENGYLTTIGNQVVVTQGAFLLLLDAGTMGVKKISKEQLGVDNPILMATPDPHNEQLLWIATKGSGIIKLNIATGKTVHYTEANGLPNNTVYIIAPDKKGLFWCSSNKGIFRFNTANGTSVSFTSKDGLQGNEFNRYHFLETPDGRFVFGGTNGYSVFHPDSVQIDSFEPPVIISEVLVNNAPLHQVVNAYSTQVVSSLPAIQLAYNQNFLTFSFAGLEYNAPDKLHYRYILENFDKSWTVAGADASAKYTSIPPGHYVFKVNTSNASGIWSKNVRTIAVTILPPWWKTGWAYCLYILLLGSIVYALYRNWLQREKTRRQIFLKQKEAEQLKAIDAIKNRFFDNITHEFRTPLSLILAPLETIQNGAASPVIKKELNGVERNAKRLLQLINQLLDLAKLESASMKVDLSRGNLAYFIQDIADQFLPRSNAKNVLLTCNVQLPEVSYLFDADKLQKILQNLLSNAVKFTSAGGYVRLVAALQNVADKQVLQVTVEDTGAGIPVEKIPYLFNRFYQVEADHTSRHEGTGIGLALVKELTELMGGTIEAISTPGEKRTIFKLKLPVEQAPAHTSNTENDTTTINQTIADQQEHFDNSETNPADTSENKPVLLITEDDAELNAFIANTFRQQYRVLTAANGKAGLELARRELPDLIISDARMPEMDGYRFCQQIKESTDTNHIAFILLTAKSAPGSIIEGLQSQADDYITKPFVVSQLLLRVSNLLHRQQTLRTYFSKQLTLPDEPIIINKTDNAFLQQVYTYIQEHLDDKELTVTNLAEAVAMSQRTLTRKLSTLIGISPIELIKQYRLKKAAELLQAGDSVAEAAYKAGYETATYFSTSFKSFYGITPTEYIKKHR